MIDSTCVAVPETIAPMRAKALPMMKNQRRPKISERRPTTRNPILRPRVYAIATQVIFGDGPISSFISARELDGKTQPR
jgi:hypothetical protein